MEKAFVYGMSVEGVNFTDRVKETKRLKMDFENGMNVILVSPRRMGKSSIVKKVKSEITNPAIKVVYMDIYDCRSEYDFYNRFASALIKQTATKTEQIVENIKRFLVRLTPKIGFSPEPLSEFTLSLGITPQNYQPEEILQLPEIIGQAQDIHIVVCIDEFQQIGEMPSLYYSQINEVTDLVIDIEFPQLRGVDPAYLPKIKQLLYVISESAPFTPNITKLGERIGLTRNSLLLYIAALHDSRLTYSSQKSAFGLTRLQKPDKIYLENTNLMFAFADTVPNVGNVRETFFANQLRHSHRLNIAEQGDFLIDGRYTFEVGGERKGNHQIENLRDAYIAADNLEYGFGNKIPLWLFGFLY